MKQSPLQSNPPLPATSGYGLPAAWVGAVPHPHVAREAIQHGGVGLNKSERHAHRVSGTFRGCFSSAYNTWFGLKAATVGRIFCAQDILPYWAFSAELLLNIFAHPFVFYNLFDTMYLRIYCNPRTLVRVVVGLHGKVFSKSIIL